MKHIKRVEVPATTKEFVSHTTCDLCKEKIESEPYETDHVTIEHRVGHCYPEDSYGERTEIDLCGKCFTERLLPWFTAQGVVPRVSDYDY